MEVAQHRLSATREQLRHIQAEAAVHTADMEMTVAELQESLEVAQYRLSATEKALQKAQKPVPGMGVVAVRAAVRPRRPQLREL